MNLHNLLSGIADSYGLGGLFNKTFPGRDPNADPNAPQGPDNYLMNGAMPGGPGTVAPPYNVAPQAPQTPQAPGGGVTATPDQEIQVTGQQNKPAVVAAQTDGVMEGRGVLNRGLPAGPQSAAPNPVNLSNDAYVVAAQKARDSAATAVDSDGNPVHHGMFGVHGKMRDLLGLFGDTVNSTNGRADIYAPEQMRERLGDAMAGSTEHPQEAIERLNSQGFTDQAKAIGDSQDNKDLREATMANTQAYHTAMMGDRRATMLGRFGQIMSNTFNGADTPTEQAAAQKSIRARMTSLGIKPEEMGLTDDMSAEDWKAAVNSGISTYQTKQAASGDLRARAAMVSAQRQPASHPAAVTDSSQAAPLLKILANGGKLTSGQNDTLTRLGHGANRGMGSKGRQPVSPPDPSIFSNN